MTRLWQAYLDLFSTPSRIIGSAIVGYLVLLAIDWFVADMPPGWFVATAALLAVCLAIGTARSIRRLEDRQERGVGVRSSP